MEMNDEKLRFIVGITLAVTLVLIVVTVLYSLVFVVQPIGVQAPNDAEFFKLINPIATFIVGALAGLMANGKKPTETTIEQTPAPKEPDLLPDDDDEEHGPF
jgi:hypothetical protein